MGKALTGYFPKTPPPWWGRVGERGFERLPAENLRLPCLEGQNAAATAPLGSPGVLPPDGHANRVNHPFGAGARFPGAGGRFLPFPLVVRSQPEPKIYLAI